MAGFWKAVTVVATALAPGMKHEGKVITSVEDMPERCHSRQNFWVTLGLATREDAIQPHQVAISKQGHARKFLTPDAQVGVEVWQEVPRATPEELTAAREQSAREYEEGHRWLLD